MFKKTSIAIFVLTLGLASVWATTPDQLDQLAGKSTDKIRVSQYGQVYQEALTQLTSQMDQTTGNTRYAHQVMLQQICLHASRPGAESQRLAMSKALADTLQSKTMTPEIRYWVLLQIERTGKSEVLETLTKSLGSADKIEQGCACAALEKNPASKANDILLNALATTKDETFAAGLISSLGNRKDHKSLNAISKQLDNSNPTVGMAAVTAMVKINTPSVVSMLKQKLSQSHPASMEIAKGLVEIAAVSTVSKANAIYEELYKWSGKVKPASSAYSIGKAALIGLAANDSSGIDRKIIAAFKDNDPSVKSMAIAAAAVAKSSGPAKTMSDNSNQLDNVLLNQLISMLAMRNETLAMKPAKQAIESNDPLLLKVVINALSQQKGQEFAALLLEIANNNDAKISKYAQQKIITSGNDHLDKLLIKAASSGKDEQRATAIALLGERNTANISRQMFEYAQSGNEVVSKAALKAIGSSASVEKVPVLCGMLKTSKADSFKKLVLSAIKEILANAQDKRIAAAIIIKEIKIADENNKVMLITSLSNCGGDYAMKYCLGLLDAAEGESFETAIPQAALKTLTKWTYPMPAKELLKRAKISKHKLAYGQAVVDLSKSMARYSKDQAKMIARDVKALNISEDINESADKIIKIR
jgi:hypothetical protein